MPPIDHRNATFRDLQGQLVSLRLAVYEALLDHGPCTTRELAQASGIDLLTVRPRVTDLVQLGFAEWIATKGHEGRYRALTMAEAGSRFEQKQNPQMLMSL